MSKRLAPGTFLAIVLMVILLVAMSVLSAVEGGGFSLGLAIAFVSGLLVIAALGYVITVRQPGNVIGPGFSALAALVATNGLADTYAEYGLFVSPGSLPYAMFPAWVSEWTWIPAFFPLITFLFLVFPDGKLLSRRWRPVAFAVAIDLAVLTLATMVSPFETRRELENPYLVTGLGSLPAAATSIAYIALIPLIGLCVTSIVLRFRRSSGIERLQLKWFASAAVASLGLFLSCWVVSAITDSDAPWSVFLLGTVALIACATAIAVLRYRLYEIDRIINRTLVYGLVTASLAVTYSAVVVGLQALLRPVNGGSDLAIVATTLLVAALFLPARSRVQRAVDRRFNRRSYNAALTVEAFSARLRQQIDLDTLRYELLGVVGETIQPSHANVWLRRGEGRP